RVTRRSQRRHRDVDIDGDVIVLRVGELDDQVEIWFSMLARRLLKRSSFISRDDLRQRVLAFIDYFNRVLAKPFRWTYTGRPLQA
ncbi:MAG: hypothetical protein KF901_22890, partial [Myxococcales bacterium]|nr:hypothetical protein [Myxococcales bacterium]